MITTDRLQLRAWREEDIEPYFAMCSDPQVMEFLLPIRSREEIAAFIGRQCASQSQHDYSFWAVERLEDGAFLGFCGMKPGAEGTPIEGQVEIGWRLRREAWGHGYAREAAAACLDWAWARINADSVWAITVPANKRSWGLMERLGMTRHTDLDFDHPAVPAGSPLMRHLTYSIANPG
jgi:RimJ/RimL family protein N-acetyltransferase